MKNVRLWYYQILASLIFASISTIDCNQVIGQVTVTNNNPTFGAYLGWNDAQDLDFKTNDILRLQLMETQTNTINGFPGIAQGGFVGLSDELNFFNPGGTGPYSMLHINGDNAGATPQQAGWRPWMKYGMTVTSNRDLMYVGHLDRGNTDETDAVVSWSDNTFGPSGPDNLRFIYTSGDGTAAPGDEDSFYGKEGGRFTGLGRFGCGDFSPSGANEQPTHQLDVNGMARVRDVPAGPHQVLITGRQAGDVGDYVLHHLAFSGDDGEVLAGDGTWVNSEADCDWETIENIPGIDDVVTGHGEDCYPAGHAGVGVTVPQAKLDVHHGPNQLNTKNIGINLYYQDPNLVVHPFVAGIKSHVRRPISASTVETYGIWSIADNAIRNRAGFFDARASTITSGNVGVWGQASGGGEVLQEAVGGRFYGSALSSPNAATYGVIGIASYGQVAYGVYGGASSASTNNWAGYFDGNTFATGLYMGSDESLKQNIESLEGALDVIQQIQPRHYDFQVDAFSQMNLPSGQQQGVIAQELEEVLPNLVKETIHPAQYDSLGNEVTAAVEFKSVNYIGLIPYLIAGMQEQQHEIGALEDVIDSQNQTLAQVLDQLDDLQQQINNCCSADGARNFESENDNQKPGLGENILHQNNPNPFRSQTTISYELEQGGKVTLNIFDKNGRPLATLVEAEQQAGEYRYEWDASGLPAGVYNYALYVDGELLVKKAIKLAD